MIKQIREDYKSHFVKVHYKDCRNLGLGLMPFSSTKFAKSLFFFSLLNPTKNMKLLGNFGA